MRSGDGARDVNGRMRRGGERMKHDDVSGIGGMITTVGTMTVIVIIIGAATVVTVVAVARPDFFFCPFFPPTFLFLFFFSPLC